MVHSVGGEDDTLTGGVPDGPGHHQLSQRHAQPLSNLTSEQNKQNWQSKLRGPGCLSCQYSVNFTQSSNQLILETWFHDMKY